MSNNQQQQPNGGHMECGLEHLLRAQAEHETASETRFQTPTEALMRLAGVIGKRPPEASAS